MKKKYKTDEILELIHEGKFPAEIVVSKFHKEIEGLFEELEEKIGMISHRIGLKVDKYDPTGWRIEAHINMTSGNHRSSVGAAWGRIGTPDKLNGAMAYYYGTGDRGARSEGVL